MAKLTLSFCRQSILSSAVSRSFATTSSKQEIPPESPEYIHVPQSLQPYEVSPRRLKGILPVPREVFPQRQPEKLEPDFEINATKPRNEELDLHSASEIEKYKHRMAERRRGHLREGLAELRARKAKTERQLAAKSQAKRQERDRVIAQAEREDERLTNSSVPKSMLPMKGQQIPDPHFQKRYEASTARVKAQEERKREERRDALHTLYMNARTFITTEADLDAEIDRVFPEGDDPAFRTPSSHGKDIWNLGVPPRVADLLKKTAAHADASGSASRGNIDIHQDLARISAERVKKIAEELSGGKI